MLDMIGSRVFQIKLHHAGLRVDAGAQGRAQRPEVVGEVHDNRAVRLGRDENIGPRPSDYSVLFISCAQ